MTKEEFFGMIATQWKQYCEKTKNSSYAVQTAQEKFAQHEISLTDYEKAVYDYNLNSRKSLKLLNLIEYPIYARIKAMTDFEIAKYKQEKKEELDLKIDALRSELLQHQDELKIFTSYKEQLLNQSNVQSDIVNVQTNIDITNSNISSIQSKINELTQQQEKILTSSVDEIKQQIVVKTLSGFGFGSYKNINDKSILQRPEYDRISEKGNKDNLYDYSQEVEDYNTASEIANKLAKLKQARSKTIIVDSKLNISGIPNKLKNGIHSSYDGESYIERCERTHDYEKIQGMINEYENEFNDVKKIIDSQFTVEKLTRLSNQISRLGIIDNLDTKFEPDFSFLQMNLDKISQNEMTRLISLVEQRNNLSNKFFKTEETKEEIHKLENQIRREYSKLCTEIQSWYENQTILMRNLGIEFNYKNITNLDFELSKISEIDVAIDRLKDSFEIVKAEYQRKKSEKEETVKKCENDVASKVDEKIVIFSNEEPKINLDRMVDNYISNEYARNLANSVQQEAQRQASKDEGVSVEELIQMRNKLLGQYCYTVPDEDQYSSGSNGMKM